MSTIDRRFFYLVGIAVIYGWIELLIVGEDYSFLAPFGFITALVIARILVWVYQEYW